MGQVSKQKRMCRNMVKEREQKRKRQNIEREEERGWEFSEEEEDVTAIGLVQSECPAPDEFDESEDDEVVVSEGEEVEEVDESAFVRLMASAAEQSRCVSMVSEVFNA